MKKAKDKILHLRIDTTDEKRWRAEADRLGLNLSSYIRLKLNLDVEEQQRHRIALKKEQNG